MRKLTKEENKLLNLDYMNKPMLVMCPNCYKSYDISKSHLCPRCYKNKQMYIKDTKGNKFVFD